MQLVLPTRLPSQITGPIVAVLARVGVTPNMLTVAQLVGGLIAAYAIARGELFAGGLILIAAATLDAIDGTLARTTGKATKFGAVLDSVFDRLFEGAVLGGILYYFLDQGEKLEPMLAFVAVVGSITVSYVRARAEGEGIALYEGLFTRFVRIVALTVGVIAAEWEDGVLTGVLWLLAVMTVVTVLQRLQAVWVKTRVVDS